MSSIVELERRIMRKHRPHWYRLFVGECPVCGHDRSYRVRVYGRRPKDPCKRLEQIPPMACSDHWL